MACGVVKNVDGGTVLRCELEAGHELPHRQGIASWPHAYVPDPRDVAARAAWHKPHVRREYETLKTWKQKRGL
jgi:hypothetical protein